MLRVIFAGTPEFARIALAAIQAAGFDIALVLSQPDRPAGRGLKLQPSPVKQWALEHGLPIAQPRSLRLDGKFVEDAQAAQQALEAAQADIMVVAAYGLILPQWVLDTPRLGCLNIHASLLPRWRGAAPIHRAIEAGDALTGITIMQMDAGLDTGDMLLTEEIAIAPLDTTQTLHDRLAQLGGACAVRALHLAATRNLEPTAQPAAGITYAHKIDKAEAAVDWSAPPQLIERRIRAFNPAPGAVTLLGVELIKLRSAELLSEAAPPDAQAGQVLRADSNGVDVCAGSITGAGSTLGVLRITSLQKAGGKALDAAQFLRGFEVQPGMVFTLPASVKPADTAPALIKPA